MQQFLSDKQVGARYGVSAATIWRWSRKETGFPKPLSLVGSTRWRLADLEAFEAAAGAAGFTAKDMPSTAAPRPGSRPRGRPRKNPLPQAATPILTGGSDAA